MTRALLSAVLVILLAPAATFAHRLDEYLQATRVSLERGRISIEIDLTPGASIASSIITLLDRDGDGRISQPEAQAYGEDVLSHLVVRFDGVPVPVTLSRVELPRLEDMRHGLDAIRLQALSEVGPFRAGRHHVHLRNSHAPVPSVYLVNALVPDDRDIRVIAQARDPQQQEVRIEYDVRSRWIVQLVSFVLAIAGCGVLVWFRRVNQISKPGAPERQICRRTHLIARARRPISTRSDVDAGCGIGNRVAESGRPAKKGSLSYVSSSGERISITASGPLPRTPSS